MGKVGNELETRIEFGKSVVDAQRDFFGRYFGRVDSQWKRDGTRVTEADHQLSNAFREAIADRFQEDQFFSEEIDAKSAPMRLTSRFSWLLDPIDGTNNFARGIPSCAISLALLDGGYPIYGYVYDFMSRSLIHGGNGSGLRIEDRAVSRYEESPNAQSLVALQHCEMEDGVVADGALQRKFKIRNFGSSAIQLAYVAMGWLDGVIANRVNSWDIAAGVALLRESGGRFHFFENNPFPMVEFDVSSPPFGYMAGSESMVDEMIATIAEANRSTE